VAQARVLLIEDDPTWLSLMGDWLRPHYRVSSAASGAAGLKQIAAQPPYAVVLDLHMAGMDGAQVLERMRKTPAGSRIPVVVFSSATVDAGLRRRLTAASGPGPLVMAAKGGKLETLLSALRSVLKG
jgi:CheY-like chemotaxis protein